MLVVKVKPDWFPVENPNLKVGDAIEMTDPSMLIKMGVVKKFEAPKIKVKKK